MPRTADSDSIRSLDVAPTGTGRALMIAAWPVAVIVPLWDSASGRRRRCGKAAQTGAESDVGMPIESKLRLRTFSDRKPLVVVFDLG